MGKADQTRQLIIEKTAPVFNVKGYAGTSLSDITEATGLTKGSIYGNFENKDEVAIEAFAYNLQKVNAIFTAATGKHASCSAQLIAFAEVYENFLHQPFPHGGCPVLNAAIEADDTHPQLKQCAAAALNGWKKMIAAIVKKGITDKEFKASAIPDETAITLIALLEGGIMIAKLTGKRSYRQTISKAIRQLVQDLKK
ncbi:TetR/AcrR family transcriptional regulator [Deminuibacter soli]|uniref:TetR/AcrR family transcriptional regulator n=1 Tax=Deminuibacter soli TaxID=2291815 RepID=A0A3E1NKI6_9BACT|nr:TetR/AcrR family transcriptional regulator [Deminuibacter soli]RFM28459.1 TetR/AcrR family transcriptional regulator [Deminuibacter soli]